MIPSALAWAARDPDRPAVIVGGARTSYGELAGHVRRGIGWLAAHGVTGAPARVAFVAVPGLDTIALTLAVLEIGATVVPLHARSTAEERAARAADARADVIVPEGWSRSPDSREREASARVTDAADDDLAIVYTSGSTGAPRGVRLQRRAWVAAARASAANLGWREDDRWLLCMPVAHVGGLSIVVRTVLAGACIVIPELARSGGMLAASALLAQSIGRDRVTLASLVPTQLDVLQSLSPAWDPPALLRAVLLGGARAPQPLVLEACSRGWPLLRTYGLTEACSQVATQRLAEAGCAIDDCGLPIEGVEVRADDDGVLAARGATIAHGIVGRAGALTDSKGWYRTGDVGSVGPSGRVRVVGRGDEMLVTGGENVWPAEVERALETLPGVAAARVVGVSDDRWGELVAALVVARGAAPLDPRRTGHAAAERLATHQRPRIVAVTDALPLGPTGKIDDALVRSIVCERGVRVS